ncbi:MAG TPA: hypothetical protein VGU43_02265 [Thermoplasmata archaeon]|nr:hypothetical protein [Thermoplasmata archaeon]
MAAASRAGLPPWKHVLALVALSPFFAEWMTGSTPPAEVLNPIAFVVSAAGLAGMYGGGVLLVRELTLRWHKGWATVLLLGAAYGVLEEGVAVHTFFQPSGSPVGILGSYGHWMGTNWVWDVGLAGFHSAVSIALPILFVALWWPEHRERRLLDGRKFAWTALAYVCTILFFAAIAPHAPSALGYAGCLVAVGGLVALARWVPSELLLAPRGAVPPRPWRLFGLGAVFLPAWLLIGQLGALSGIPPALTIALVLAACEGSVLLGYRFVGRLLPPESAFYFLAGTVGALMGFSLVLGLGSPAIGTLVNLPIAGALLWLLHRRIAHDRRTLPAAPTGPSEVPAGARAASPRPY